MLEFRRGLVVVGCVFVGFVVSAGPGLVARAAEPERWAQTIATDVARSATADSSAQRRIAELEQRVRELEAERQATAAAGERSQEPAAASARSAELSPRHRALASESPSLVQSRALDARTQAGCEAQADADPKERLRYWARQMRDGKGFRARMSSDWNAALNVILRRERQLDPNPWREQ